MPFAHTHREDFSKKNGVCQLFSRRFTGICRNLSISGKIKPLNRLPLGGKLSVKRTDEGRNLFSNCLSKVALRKKNCQPLRGFPLPAENFSLQNFLRQKCEAFLASGFPLLHFAQRKIQQKLSASFRGFPSGGSSLRSKVMRGAACLWFSEYSGRNF